MRPVGVRRELSEVLPGIRYGTGTKRSRYGADESSREPARGQIREVSVADRILVKNWERFQHYRNRRPPWIKLHRTLLDDPLFLRLPLASMALAPLLWLLASETDDGSIPVGADDLAFRLRISEKVVRDGLAGLIASGFLVCLQDASKMLAPCKQDATPERETEREGETETERECDASTTLATTTAKRFTPPTAEEVQAYLTELGERGFTGQTFVDYYQAKGWRVGASAMKDWRAAVRTWRARRKESQQPPARTTGRGGAPLPNLEDIPR